MSSVVIKSIDREMVDQAVREYARWIRTEHPEILRIIWFGSWVTGLPSPGSDVDLCLILSASDKRPRDRLPDYLRPGFPVGVDIFAYTQDEFVQLQDTSPGWYKAILSGQDI